MRRIVHLSDLHFGAIDDRILAPLSDAVRDARPDLVVVSGDLTQRARRREFEAAAAFLATLPSPRLVVPGNHDIPLYDVAARIFAPLDRYRHHIAEDLSPVFADDEMMVVGLNSTRALGLSYGRGRLNRAQAEEAAAALTRAPAGAAKIVVTHHPFDIPPGVDAQHLVGRAAMAMAHLAAAGADLFLAGHLHVSHVGPTAARYKIAGHSALVVQAGTISRRGRGEPNAFAVVDLDLPDARITRQTWSDDARAFTTTWHAGYRRSVDGWRETDPPSPASV
jgi:3',5'-cyclic AMP phosphodiesterase CpdA